MLRHIAWFNKAPIEPCPEGGLTSPDPVVQRRYLIPARKLEELGVECSVFGNLQDADPVQVSQHLQKLETDIVVVGDISGSSRLELARAAKHLGCYVIADFGHASGVTSDFVQLAEMADQVVAATPEAAALALKETGSPTAVIPDCSEGGNGATSAAAVAQLWLDCFKKLKLKPPASANTNLPE
ncbi:MAG: hypothetical protein SFW62_08620 [Alphaproteobacteria bacterium]|nr:hypothetical protein [Alphaproteobacteria bacterium]